MSEDIYEDGDLDIGSYAGPLGGDRKRFQITAWCDHERTHVALTRMQAARVAVELTRYFNANEPELVVAAALAGIGSEERQRRAEHIEVEG